MAGNSFGERFRVTTFGESHGGAVGVIVDGCPAGHPFPRERIAAQLARRRPGQPLTSQRREDDEIEVLAGVEPKSDRTLGTPIAMMVRNTDVRAKDYDELRDVYRPSHADFTYDARFGLRFVEGGGRASARETVGRVAAGAIAEDLLAAACGIEIVAWVASVHDVDAFEPDVASVSRADVDASAVRCPDVSAAEAMTHAIEDARKHGDTVGGIVRAVCRNVPAGLGEPVFDRLEADLAKAMLSLPATKGFEIGSGFAGTMLKGSQHNDVFVNKRGTIGTLTNRSGGIQGGISNGEEIVFRVGFKPTATILQPQRTVDLRGAATTLKARGRHDPCVVPRAPVIVEAMTALVLVDHWMRHAAQNRTFKF